MNKCQRAHQLSQFAAASALAVYAAGAAANYVDGQSREWLDMSQVTGTSWNAINSVCQSETEASGPCSGLLGGAGGYDLTGWTWASRSEVVGLIQSFMLATGDNTGQAAILSQNGYGTQNYSWADDLIDAMGQTGMVGFSTDRRTIGFMNGLDTVGFNTTGQQAFICTGSPCGHESYVGAGVSAGVNPATSNAMYAGWFYRTTTTNSVPEPSVLLIALTGLVGVGGFQLRAATRAKG